MKNNNNIPNTASMLTIPEGIRREFGTPNDPDALVLAETYRGGANSDTDPVWLRYIGALSQYPEHKAFLDIQRNITLGHEALNYVGASIAEQESGHEVEFRATTFEEAESLPNQFDEEMARIVFDIVQREGTVDLSRNVYRDNVYEQAYSSDIEELDREYYAQVGKLKDRYSKLGFNIQGQLAFTQYNSPKYLERLREGRPPKPTKRIYLNPHPQDTAEVYSRVLDAMVENDIAAQSKVSLDPFVEGSFMKHRDDRIVMYVDDSQANEVLTLVGDIYREYEESFKDSRVPIVTTELAPGFSVAGEKNIRSNDGDGYSASGYREAILSRLINALPEKYRNTIKDGTYDSRLLTVFSQKANEAFRKLGINESNWSFYK